MSVRPRRRRRRPSAVLWLVWLALVLVVFGLGVAVGEALHDNPKPSPPVTIDRTLSVQTRTSP